MRRSGWSALRTKSYGRARVCQDRLLTLGLEGNGVTELAGLAVNLDALLEVAGGGSKKAAVSASMRRPTDERDRKGSDAHGRPFLRGKDDCHGAGALGRERKTHRR